MSLPNGFVASEFALSIGWRPLVGYGSGDDIVPGFYLRAAFANEGSTHDALAEHPSADPPKKVLLTPQTLTNVLTMLSSDPRVPNHLMNLGGPLVAEVEAAQHRRLSRQVQKLRTLREDIAEQEQALRDAGLDPEAV